MSLHSYKFICGPHKSTLLLFSHLPANNSTVSHSSDNTFFEIHKTTNARFLRPTNANSWVRYLATVLTLLISKYTVSKKKLGSKKKQENNTKDNPCGQSYTPQAAVTNNTQRCAVCSGFPCPDTFMATGLTAGGNRTFPNSKSCSRIQGIPWTLQA